MATPDTRAPKSLVQIAAMNVTVIVLTKNEEQHIARCLRSVRAFASHVLVVDSGSTDRTVDIARAEGAEIRVNAWVNHAVQLNWGIAQVPKQTDWIMRLDADEVVQPELAREIAERLPTLGGDVGGVYVPRRMTFMGRPIRWGGVFPVRILRIFRNGKGRCENRWMDEHIVVAGRSVDFSGEIIDDNRNPLSWWTEKHNAYASREVVDLLNREFGFMSDETGAGLQHGRHTGLKRWLKEHIYMRTPGGLRAFLYFVYRYVFRLGLLDGREGAAFHVLQGFWYRYLVDAKLYEVKKHMREHQVDAVTAIRDVLKIEIAAATKASAVKNAPDVEHES